MPKKGKPDKSKTKIRYTSIPETSFGPAIPTFGESMARLRELDEKANKEKK